MIFVVLALFVGMYLGSVAPYWIGSVVLLLQRRHILKDLLPKEINENKLCKNGHTWFEADSIDENSELIKVNVCTVCGLIPSRQVMASNTGLERIKENQEAITLEKKVQEEFIQSEEKYIKDYFSKELEDGLDYKKLIKVYNAGQASRSRFIMFKILRAEKIETKNNKENSVSQ